MKQTGNKFKYVILVRHGEPDNKKNIVYNLDEVMKKEDIIHLTDYGREQLRALGRVIKKKQFRVTSIRHSNQIRAVESALALNEILKVKDTRSDTRLSDVYAPGPYLEKLTMEEWKKGNNAYNKFRWVKYNHESPESILNRINKVFEETVITLEVGKTAILLSHGDPIAWFINYKVAGKLPNPQELRNLIYPVQGQGIVIVINPKNKMLNHYILKDPLLLTGESY